MTIPSKILHSAISGRTPSSLVSGQLAINEADRVLFYLDPTIAGPSSLLDQVGAFRASANLIINGAMEVDQINRGNLLATVNGYAIDMVKATKTGVSVVSTQQIVDAPPGLLKCLKVQVTTPNASPSATDFTSISFPVEGYRIQRLGWGVAGALNISIGLWVKAFRPGVYALSVSNNAANRGYSTAFTVVTTATWQFVSVTIPGDVIGTWPAANGRSLIVTVFMMAGPSLQLTANTWSSSVGGVAGMVNGAQSAQDYMQVTGVCMFPGYVVPSATGSLTTALPFSETLELCQRYWQKSYDYETAVGAVTSNGASETFISAAMAGAGTASIGIITRFPVPMMTVPTITSYSSNTGASGKAFDVFSVGDVVPSANGAGQKGFGIVAGQIAPSTDWNMRHQWTADARM